MLLCFVLAVLAAYGTPETVGLLLLVQSAVRRNNSVLRDSFDRSFLLARVKYALAFLGTITFHHDGFYFAAFRVQRHVRFPRLDS